MTFLNHQVKEEENNNFHQNTNFFFFYIFWVPKKMECHIDKRVVNFLMEKEHTRRLNKEFVLQLLIIVMMTHIFGLMKKKGRIFHISLKQNAMSHILLVLNGTLLLLVFKPCRDNFLIFEGINCCVLCQS